MATENGSEVAHEEVDEEEATCREDGRQVAAGSASVDEGEMMNDVEALRDRDEEEVKASGDEVEVMANGVEQAGRHSEGEEEGSLIGDAPELALPPQLEQLLLPNC